MLLLNTGTQPPRPIEADHRADAAAARAVWLDLVAAGAEEQAVVERATGLRVPTEAELSEIESSSRLSHRDGVLTMSTPLVARAAEEGPVLVSVGVVLSPERMLTVRPVPMRAFEDAAARFADAGPAERCSAGAFLDLMEAVVDRIADVLEQVGGELDAVSRAVFRRPAHERPSRTDRDLRETLRTIGRAGDLVSNLRAALLGVGRMSAYVADVAEWLPPGLRPRFGTLRADIASLADYDAQLTGKVQFLLDATLGFISIQQNNVIKVLTVVSVVGVPPTLVASIYGMNFKGMPELDWAWGYPYALTLIVLSALLPLLWFLRRGWL